MGLDVMDIVIGILLVAILVPIAFTRFFAADTSSWDASVADIWPLIPLFVIVGLLYYYKKTRGGSGNA